MKTSYLLSTLVGLICFTVNLQAGGSEKSKEQQTAELISDKIRKEMAFAPLNISTIGDGEVSLKFHLNDQYELVIDAVESTNGFLVRHIRKTLKGKKIYVREDAIGRSFTVRFKFV